MDMSDQEREMLLAFRSLPVGVREAIRKTIESQANYYAPERARSVVMPARLSLVVGGRRRI
jgi:hypothetical protein